MTDGASGVDAEGADGLAARLRAGPPPGTSDDAVAAWEAKIRVEAAAEIDRLQALLSGDFVEAARLERLSYGRGSPLETVFTAPVMRVVAAHLAEALRVAEATNWLELQVVHEELGPLVFTVQRAWGETPGQAAARHAAALRGNAASPDGVREDAEG